eukprot:5845711-Pyramimonas_sp.AAC.1
MPWQSRIAPERHSWDFITANQRGCCALTDPGRASIACLGLRPHDSLESGCRGARRGGAELRRQPRS